jgi:hypothetical protein
MEKNVGHRVGAADKSERTLGVPLNDNPLFLHTEPTLCDFCRRDYGLPRLQKLFFASAIVPSGAVDTWSLVGAIERF